MGLTQELILFELLHGCRSGRLFGAESVKSLCSVRWRNMPSKLNVSGHYFIYFLLCNIRVPIVGLLLNRAFLSRDKLS